MTRHHPSLEQSLFRPSRHLGCLLALSLGVAACSPPKDLTPFRLGYLSYFGPQGGSLGNPLKEATESAVAAVNAAGGIDGAPVELFVQDAELAEGVPAAWDLLAANQLHAISAPLLTSDLKKLVSRINDTPMLVISPSSTSPELVANDYVYRVAPNDTIQAYALAHHLSRIGVKKVTVLYGNSSFGQAVRDLFIGAFTSAGGTVGGTPVAVIQPSEFITDALANDAYAAVAAQSPEWVVAMGFGLTKVIKSWYAAGTLPNLRWMGLDVMANASQYAAMPDLKAGAIQGMAPVNPNQGEAFKHYEQSRGLNATGIQGAYGPKAWDAVHLLAAAAMHQRIHFRTHEGGPDLRASLVEVSKGGQVMHAGQWGDIIGLIRKGGDVDYDGAGGPVDFDENGEVIGPYSAWELVKGASGYSIQQAAYYEAHEVKPAE